MKILFPIGSFYPAQVGGPNNTIFWLAKSLVKQGKEIYVVTTNKGLKSNKIEIDTWITFNSIQVIYHSYKIWQFPVKFLSSALKEIKSSNLIILSSFFYSPSILISLWIGLIRNKTLLISPRGEFSESALQYYTCSKKFRISFMKFLIGKKLVFHSTSAKETLEIKKIFPRNRIIEIPNFMELPSKENISVEESILFLGRIHPIKAIENILLGLSISEKFLHSNYIFQIAGDESDSAKGYKSQLIKRIKELGLLEKVKFLGAVTGNSKQKLLSRSKCLLLLSHSENFGNVVIEALSQGTPVIASTGTPWSILETEQAGFWILNSPIEIRKKIDIIIDINESRYLELRHNAYQLAKQKFDIQQNMYQWEKAINTLGETNIN